MRVNPAGTVEVLTGSHSHGQGHETTFAQLVSRAARHPHRAGHDRARRHRQGAVRHGHLRLALRRGRHVGDLQGDRQGDREGQEGRGLRARGVRRRHRVQGRHLLRGAAPTSRSTFGEVALQAYIAHKFYGPGAGAGPEGRRVLRSRPTSPSRRACTSARSRSIPRPASPRSTAGPRSTISATLINPMIVEGQVHGGIAQGVGQALLEGAHYDEDGQLVTASYMDYCMPRADDLPSFQVGTTVTPCPSNPLGIKGCGEAGAIAAPAGRHQRHHRRARPRGHRHAGDAAGRVEGARSPRRRSRRSEPPSSFVFRR